MSLFKHLRAPSWLPRLSRKGHGRKASDKTAAAPMVDSALSMSSCVVQQDAEDWHIQLDIVYEQAQRAIREWYAGADAFADTLVPLVSPARNHDPVLLHETQTWLQAYVLTRSSANKVGNGQPLASAAATLAPSTGPDHANLPDQRYAAAELRSCMTQLIDIETQLRLFRQTVQMQMDMLCKTKPADMPHSDKFDAYKTELETAYNDMDTQLLRIIDRSTPLPDEYTCSVCYSVYRDPVTIHPCLHTFCKTCLDRVYCTCRLSHCTSRCHDQHDTSSGSAGGDDDDDDEMQRHGAVHAILGGDAPLHPAVAVLMQMPLSSGSAGMSEKKPRTKNRHKMGKRSKPAWLDARPPPNRSFHERSPVPLECHCPLSWAVPPAAQCPLCRQAFGPANCTYATDMANLIRFHFYAQLPTPAKHGNATSSRVALNHATAWLKDASKTLAEWTFSIAGAGAPLVYTDIPPRRRPANNPYPLPLSSSSPPLSPTTTTITRPAPRPNQTHQYDMVLPQDVVTYARATCLF